ncbi:MAG: hypothetical protein ABF575_00435 [Liquorilactobacillus hordei]|uniref:hypothetical protein n=1 Tax=Liquorilactobacillus hordei TaxID=468911 RepID=UPI0039E910BE
MKSNGNLQNGIKYMALLLIAIIVIVVFLLKTTGGSTNASSTFTTDSQNDVAINKVKVISVGQNPNSQDEQHFLIHHADEYYLVNYTGTNGDSAVEDSIISFKGASDGKGNITNSLVNMGIDSSYEGEKVEIVEVTKNNLRVNKAE